MTEPPQDDRRDETTTPVAPTSASRAVFTMAGANLVPAVVTVLTGPILAHALGVQGRGELAAATAPFGLVTSLLTLGVPEAVTFTVARNPRAVHATLRAASKLLAAAGLLATVIVIAGAQVLSGGDDVIARLIVVASVAIVPSLLVGAMRGAAIAVGQWSAVFAERIVFSVARLVALVVLLLAGALTPLAAVIVVAVLPLGGAVIYLRVLRGHPDAADQEPIRTRGLLTYGLRTWAGSVSGVILMRVDQTLITPLAGPVELGLYVVAVSVSELPLIVNSAVRDVTFVAEAKGGQDDRLGSTARISTFVCAVVGLVVGTTMFWWLPWAFGADFEAALPVAVVLLIAVVGGTPGSIAGTALTGRGRPGLRSVSLIVACIVNIVAIVLLVPTWGAVGAAVATLIGNLVSSNLNIWFAYRYFKISPVQFYGLRQSDLVTLRNLSVRVLRKLRGRLRH